jgi:sugar lactone lactonase YvrE
MQLEAVNVWYDGAQNNSVYIQRAAIGQHGLGTVTVSTAGGTSAAFDLNVIRVDVAGTSLGDLAVDASGTLWVLDYGNPGKLQRIDRGTGAVLQSIDMTEAWGTPYTVNHAGLQVLARR